MELPTFQEETPNIEHKNNRVSESTAHTEGTDMDIEGDDNLFLELDRKRSLMPMFEQSTASSASLTPEAMLKLADWMFGIFWRFDMNDESILLCLGLMKLYFKNRNAQRHKLQTVGMVTMYIASKYSENAKLTVPDILPYCLDIQGSDCILEIEADILFLVEFNLEIPTVYKYFEAYRQVYHQTKEEELKTIFWLEVWMVNDLMSDLNEKEVLLEVLGFVKDPANASELLKHLLGFLEKTEFRYVVKRFLSCLDVDAYLKEIRGQ